MWGVACIFNVPQIRNTTVASHPSTGGSFKFYFYLRKFWQLLKEKKVLPSLKVRIASI